MSYSEKDLYLAALNGNVIEVKKCLASGVSVDCKPYNDLTPLHVADNKEVSKILIQNGADVNSRNKINLTPLDLTTSKDVAKMLLENGADIFSHRSLNRTALYYTRNKEVADILIQHGGDVNNRDTNGDTPLHCAVQHNEFAMMKELILLGADLTATNNEGDTPLHHAANKKHWFVKCLISQGANVLARNNKNQTPLHLVELKEVAEILIQNGANVNSLNSNNQSPLHVSKNIEVAGILIQNGADVNTRDINGNKPLDYVEETYKKSHQYMSKTKGDSPLHQAASQGEHRSVKTLISLGANLSARNNENQTPLHVARHKKVADILIQNGADVNSRDINNQTPLHVARHKKVADILIQNGADVNSRDINIQTALHVAKNKKVSAVLIQNGADVNSKDGNNQTALHLAKEKEVAEVLIQNGADVNSRDSNKRTPLHVTRTKEVAEILLLNGADVNSRDNDARTPLEYAEETYKHSHWYISETMSDPPLHQAASQGEQIAVELLICLGANLSARNNEGDTPLHHAVENGELATAKVLIRSGADITAKNNQDMTPLDAADDAYEKNKDYSSSNIFRDTLDYLKTLTDTSGKTREQSSVFENKDKDIDIVSALPYTGQSKDKKEPVAEFPWIGNPSEFKVILSKGTYQSFDNRVFLAGACNCGKSTLASVLIGDDIPLTWKSTDGLVVYFGRNGIHLKTEEMVPLKDGSGGHTVFSRILRGQPNVLQNKGQPSVKTSKSSVRNFVKKIKNAMRSNRSEAVNEVEIKPLQVPDKTAIRSFTSGPAIEKKQIVHTTEECGQLETDDKQDVSKLDHYTVRDDILEEVRKGQYIIEIAPSDLVDFGGQRSYDMTHQLFIQHRGSFIIMFNGKYDLKTPLMEYPQGDVTSESLIMHWINSILTYCPEGDDIMPMVLFAATHSDYFNSEEGRIRKMYFTREISNLFREHEQRKHMFLNTVYFINGTDTHDPEIKALTRQLVHFAMQQSTWGQKRPMAWVPLELQIDNMRSQNINIITRNQLEYINRLNEDLALTEGQLEDFLQNQHTIGKVMYYKQPGLEGFVIIHTPALVNIMRSFITDEMFWPDIAELKEILLNLVLTGNIYKSNLWKLWRQDSFNQYLPTDELKAFVTKLLIHLDILIQPKGYNLASGDERFLVPCMVNKSPPPEFFLRGTSDSNTIVLTYDLAITYIPSALAFKVIGAASNNWLLKEEDGKQCLFHKAAIFMVDDDNEIRMCLEDNRVMVNLVNRKSLQFLSPDIAASVQECLTKTLESCIAFYYRSNGTQVDPKDASNKITIEVGVVCNNSVCLLNLNEASQGIEWTCATGNQNHKKKYPMYWFFDRKQKECHQRCTGLGTTELETIPSNRHLIRLASKFEMSLFGEFIIHMGLETQEYRNIQHQYDANGVHSVMFMAMVKCMKDIEAKLKRPSLKPIRDALIAVDLNHHFLCQIFREDTSLNDVSESRLQNPVDDDVLTELPKHIGNCVIHLGIELGLTVEDIEASMYNYPKDMYSQIASVLRIWKTSSKTPTVFALMKALQHVKSGGLSYLCQRYNVWAQD